MTTTTPADVVAVHGELLQAFFQSCVTSGAISDDNMAAIFAMTTERLRSTGAADGSGAMSYLSQFVQNVRMFADLRDKKLMG
jgi:hypothetical protein